MFKLFIDSFKKTNRSIILTIPLIAFILIAEIYYSGTKSLELNLGQTLLSIATIIIVLSAFMACWFYMAKKVLKYSDKIFVFEEDRGSAFREVLLSFPKGFGKFFLPFLGFILIYILFFYLLHISANFFISRNVGGINFGLFNIGLLLNPLELHSKLLNLSSGGDIAFSYWICSMGIGISIASFLTILWIPEIIYTKKDILTSLFNSIKKIIITLPKTFILYFSIQLIIIFSSILTVICMDNIYLYFLAILFYYYLFIYIIVLLYTYYEETFLK